MILRDTLFDDVLFKPALELDVDRLLIVSGYGTADMAERHLRALAEKDKSISVELIIGMATTGDGIKWADHQALKEATKTGILKSKFSCHYILKTRPVHAKAYLWLKGDKPVKAFIGSANYTKAAFSQIKYGKTVYQHQIEFLTECLPDDIDDIKHFFDFCKRVSESCLQDGIEAYIKDKPEPEPEPKPELDPKELFSPFKLTKERESAIGWINTSSITPRKSAPEELVKAFETIKTYLKKENFAKEGGKFFTNFSIGGVPVYADGIRQIEFNSEAMLETLKAKRYNDFAKRSNKAKNKLFDMVNEMEEGTINELPNLFICELRKVDEADANSVDTDIETPEVI